MGSSYQKNGSEVVKEEAVWHEVSGVEDDGRKHVEEEDVGGEGGRRPVGRQEEQEADQDTDDDEQARLREDVRQLRGHVEACKGWINRIRLNRM